MDTNLVFAERRDEHVSERRIFAGPDFDSAAHPWPLGVIAGFIPGLRPAWNVFFFARRERFGKLLHDARTIRNKSRRVERLHGIARRSVHFVGLLHGGFCFLEQGKGHADLEGRKVLHIEKMVFPANGFVGNSRFVEHRAKFGVQARVVSLPKRAKRIFFVARRRAGIRFEPIRSHERKFVDQIDVAVSATREPGAVLGAALRAEHNRQCNTKDRPRAIGPNPLPGLGQVGGRFLRPARNPIKLKPLKLNRVRVVSCVFLQRGSVYRLE